MDLFSRRFLEVVWTLGLFNGSLRARACDRCSTRTVPSWTAGPAGCLPFFSKKTPEGKLELETGPNFESFFIFYLLFIMLLFNRFLYVLGFHISLSLPLPFFFIFLFSENPFSFSLNIPKQQITYLYHG